MAAIDQLTGLINLSNVLGGKSATTKGTQSTTQQTNISDTGAQELLRQLLSGPGGLANISGQARGSGLYDSTTEAVLKGNAAARAAADIEARRSPTTQTSNTTSTVQQPGINIGTLAAPLALGLGRSLLGKGIDYVSNLMNPITAAPGVTLAGQGVAGGTLASAASLANAGTGQSLAAALGGATPAAAETAASLGGALAGTGSSLLGGAGASVGSSVGSTLGSGITAAPGLTLGSAGTAIGGTASLGALDGIGSLAMENIPVVGSVLSGLLGGGIENTSLEQFLGSVGSGALAAGPMGMLAAPVAMTFGAMLNDLGLSSIVCTALVKKGLLDEAEYKKGQAYIQTISKYTIRGYYIWGKPMAAKIDEEVMLGPWTKRALPWAKSRTKLIASTGWTKYFKYPRGTLTLIVGQPLCWALGYVDSFFAKLSCVPQEGE